MKKILLLTVLVLMFSINRAHASNCAVGDKFNSNTGLPCTAECSSGDLFSNVTGKPCASTGLPTGCTSINGYSVLTGIKCYNPITQASPITTNKTSIMENQVTQSPSSESATVPPVVPVVLPIITNQLVPNNRTQTFSIKTNVPTTVIIDYVNQTALIAAQGPMFTGAPSATYIGGSAGMNGLLIPYIANPANILTYTDSNLTTEHEIPYSVLNLITDDVYFTKVTITDEQGNSYTFDGYKNDGDQDGKLNSWCTSFPITTNKNG